VGAMTKAEGVAVCFIDETICEVEENTGVEVRDVSKDGTEEADEFADDDLNGATEVDPSRETVELVVVTGDEVVG
jgi:hypothetical protein